MMIWCTWKSQLNSPMKGMMSDESSLLLVWSSSSQIACIENFILKRVPGVLSSWRDVWNYIPVYSIPHLCTIQYPTPPSPGKNKTKQKRQIRNDALWKIPDSLCTLLIHLLLWNLQPSSPLPGVMVSKRWAFWTRTRAQVKRHSVLFSVEHDSSNIFIHLSKMFLSSSCKDKRHYNYPRTCFEKKREPYNWKARTFLSRTRFMTVLHKTLSRCGFPWSIVQLELT